MFHYNQTTLFLFLHYITSTKEILNYSEYIFIYFLSHWCFFCDYIGNVIKRISYVLIDNRHVNVYRMYLHLNFTFM